MKVEKGKTVKIEYEGKLDDGTVFDSNVGKEPLEVTAGVGQLIKGFDAQLIDMEPGQEKDFKLEPADAYGDVNDQLVKEVPKDKIPPEAKVGTMLALSTPDGMKIPATITKMEGESVTIDMNHPLAGKSLNFHIKVTDVSDEPPKHDDSCGCGC
jgi:FKBP-type peptidyl-prolyl cis-trans isomerase 2